jgi:hypothetical protein
VPATSVVLGAASVQHPRLVEDGEDRVDIDEFVRFARARPR